MTQVVHKQESSTISNCLLVGCKILHYLQIMRCVPLIDSRLKQELLRHFREPIEVSANNQDAPFTALVSQTGILVKTRIVKCSISG